MAKDMVAGESSFVLVSGERSTKNGATVDVGNTNGVPSDDLAGFGKLDPPVS